MNEVRAEILQKVWYSKDPLAERSAFRGRVDFQGWASDNPLLARAIVAGASAQIRNMATQPVWFESLRMEAGYPSLYKTFCANVIERGFEDMVVPLPLDSLNAAMVFVSRQITPDVIHIDGAHDYSSVMSDLRAWWPLLAPGGVLIGDDYHPSGDIWPGVQQAFHEFFATTALENFMGKCYIKKSA